MSSALEGSCEKCGQPADKKCGNCHAVNYCSAQHQREHWKEHRKVCSPFAVKHSEELGRYLVAARDLPERFLVIKEAAFVFAPYDQAEGDEGDDVPKCLGCCCKMSDQPDRRCSTCHWPLCGDCEKSSLTHISNECPILAAKKAPFPPPRPKATYSSILILRLLLQKERSPRLWSQFLLMEHHRKERLKKSSCRRDDAGIFENLRVYLGDGVMEEQEDGIGEIIGRVSVNSFGVHRKEDGKKDFTVGRGVYLKAGIHAHSCIPNAVWGISYSPNFNIIIRTSVPISKGQMITPSYSDLWNSIGTYHRLSAMFERQYFICHCHRCTDPTEMGTFISGIKCPKCPPGYLLALHPTDLTDTAVWECNNCRARDVQRTIVDLVDDLQYEVDETAQDCKAIEQSEKLEQLYEKYSGRILHPNHFVIRSIEKAIIEILHPLLEQCSFELLASFVGHCENLLRVNDILSPGYTGHGGALRSYLRNGMVEQKIKALAEGSVSAVFHSPKAFEEHLRKINRLKFEASLHLENDPDATPKN